MRLLHFADLHLGMTNFGHIVPSAGIHSRIVEYMNAMDQLCDVAENSNLDLIVFAGDAFRSRTPNPTLVTLLAHRIRRLADVAPMIMIVGNHDRQRVGMKQHSIAIFDNLGSRHPIVVSDSVDAYYVLDGLVVITLPWMYEWGGSGGIASTLESVYGLIDKYDEHMKVLLGHCTVETATIGPHTFGDDSAVFPLEAFCEEDLDYVALGHIHQSQCLCSDPPVIYSGSIQRVDWAERDYDHGFVVVDISDGYTDCVFHKLDIRPMVQLDLEYSDMIDCIREVKSTLGGAIVRVHIADVPDRITNDRVRRLVLGELESVHECEIDGIFPARERTYRQSAMPSTVVAMDVEDTMMWYIRDTYGGERATQLQRAALKLMAEVDGQ